MIREYKRLTYLGLKKCTLTLVTLIIVNYSTICTCKLSIYVYVYMHSCIYIHFRLIKVI